MAVSQNSPPPIFDDRFEVRTNRLPPLSRKFHFYDELGNRIAFVKISDHRVLATIDVFDGTGRRPLFSLRERVPFWPTTCDLFEAVSGEKIGALQQRPWKSVFRQEWMILGPSDQALGRIRQNSLTMAFLHHFLIVVPVRYTMYAGESVVGTCRQSWNPVMPKIRFDFTYDPEHAIDRRFAAAAAVLLLEYTTHGEN